MSLRISSTLKKRKNKQHNEFKENEFLSNTQENINTRLNEMTKTHPCFKN